MTQLNLSGKQSTTTQRGAAEEPSRGITNQTLGALGALGLFAAVIIIGSCSQRSKPAVVQQAVQPSAPVTTPAPSTPVAAVPAPQPTPAKNKNRRASTLSYVNRDYGVSFRFARKYQLQTGESAKAAWSAMEVKGTNFVQPGGTTLAAVELPDNSYPGTDFESALISLSIKPGMTANECSQFAFPESDSQPKTPEVVKAGANDFTKVENSDSASTDQTEAEYYHAFRNGTCYEFALAVTTGKDQAKPEAEIAKVDRSEVLARLEKILATAKLPSAEAVSPETVSEAPAAGSAVSSSGSAESDTHPNN
jgi:hypothetical protein